jgi:hypothetical protein
MRALVIALTLTAVQVGCGPTAPDEKPNPPGVLEYETPSPSTSGKIDESRSSPWTPFWPVMGVGT